MIQEWMIEWASDYSKGEFRNTVIDNKYLSALVIKQYGIGLQPARLFESWHIAHVMMMIVVSSSNAFLNLSGLLDGFEWRLKKFSFLQVISLGRDSFALFCMWLGLCQMADCRDGLL